MLERTAGCLETGSLRRLIPGPKKPLKSRRSLHSGFWNHGAIDLEFSPLWAALIRGPDPVDQNCESEQQKNSTGSGGMLLDFLYPAGTIGFLRQYSGWGVDRQDGRRSVAGFAKLGHRLYTSSAKDLSAWDEDVEASKGSQDCTEDAESVAYLQKVMGLERRGDYEEAWRQYSLLEVSEQGRLRLQLIKYFSISNRVVDAERTTELFEQLADKYQRPSAYIATIRAYLRLQNLPDAIMLEEAALAKFNTPTGSDQILAYMIDRSLWPHAFRAWQKFRDFQIRVPETRYDILQLVYKLPTLVARTFEMADYVTRRIDMSSNTADGSASELLEFASTIVKHLLLVDAPSDQSKFNRLLQILEGWGLCTPEVYEKGVQQLLHDWKNTKPAVQLYRKARREKDVKFSLIVLHKLLRTFCHHHSILGMQQILDDFFRFYEGPSKGAYQMCMREFALQGDADTVHALFDQYTSRLQARGKIGQSADEFAPLLHVHAKRGELAAVVDIFDEIRDRYGLEPTLLCWNIVLDAYGKVHDTDGAFACFDQLLRTTKLQPDDYTFGTMMGICASSGDRERAAELLQLADRMGIEKSAAMIDSLVVAYLKDECLLDAEKVVEDCLKLKLKGSRTRMWNSLLVAYALRRDLQNVNRLLRRMSEAKIEYDQFTYSALMLALAMVKQPDRARAIMKDVMREAGIAPTNFHYAVLMGGYIANGEFRKVFYIQNEMIRRGIKNSASSRLLALKAAAAQDQIILESGTEEQQSQRALEMFSDIMNSMDIMDIAQSTKKGAGGMPVNIAYTSMINSYMMFVLSQRGELKTVGAVYEEYIKTLPENQRESPPIQALSALMISKLQAYDYEGAQECWDLAIARARKQGQGVPQTNASNSDQPSATPKIVEAHRLDLTKILTTQMISLAKQKKLDDIPPLINSLLEEGFLLDNHNWNHYIQLMARKYRYKLAFELCETMLMPNWTGWARIRWQAPERNRLPIETRHLKKMPKHYRPKSHTFLYLARGYLELQSMAAESPASQIMLTELERSCPKSIHAIRTMQRADDTLERQILRDFVV
jgi:pentatricopeptide repeat-containing protein PET309